MLVPGAVAAVESDRKVKGQAQVDHFARTYERGRALDPLRGEQVDRAELVVFAKHAPGMAFSGLADQRQLGKLW